MSTAALILIAIASIALLLALVMWLKWPVYLALLTVSVLTGLVAGIQIDKVTATIIEVMGDTLGSVALLLGLGSMLSGIIERSGRAEVIATKAGQILGQQRLGPVLLIASGLVAIPIFFDVAYIILVPIIFSCAKAAGHRNPVILGVPVRQPWSSSTTRFFLIRG